MRELKKRESKEIIDLLREQKKYFIVTELAEIYVNTSSEEIKYEILKLFYKIGTNWFNWDNWD